MRAGVAGSRRVRRSGHALIELALVLPLLFLLIFNVLNFGGMLVAWITVSHAARNGAQYLMLRNATIGAPTTPTNAQVISMVSQDMQALPNYNTATIVVCTNNSGTIACAGGSATPPSDPESTYYVLGSVDVTYTYTPYVSLWSFPSLGIYLTVPPTTIHRQCAMRLGGS